MADALAVWAVVTALGLAAQPAAAWALSPLPGAAAGLARPLGLLLAGVALWLAVSVGAVSYGTGPAWAALAALCVAGAVVAWRSRGRLRPTRRDLAVLAGAELVFTGAYVFALVIAAHAPDVWGTEKPMDMAFVNAVQDARSFPPRDPWLSGESLNYYYLGHYLLAFVARIAGSGPTESYNAAVALVWALGAGAAFGLGAIAVAARRRSRAWIAGGFATAALAVAGGNALGAWTLLGHDGPLESYDWFGASRAVPGGINEFPAAQAVLGDLHAHVISVPFTLLALALALHVALHGPRLDGRLALAALVLGALHPLNAWAFPVILTVLVGAAAIHRPGWRRLAVWTTVLVGGGLVAFLPFHLRFDPGGAQGLAWVPDRQSLGAFLADLGGAHGFTLVIVLALAAVRLDARGRRRTGLVALVVLPLAVVAGLAGPAVVVVALAACALLAAGTGVEPVERYAAAVAAVGLACVLAPELVYVRDAFAGGAYYRMNTLHKVGFEAWLLLGVAAGIAVGAAWRPALAIPLAVLALATLSYPLAAGWARTQGLQGPARLSGLGWLEAMAPGDPPAIAWLRAHASHGAVVLEAVGPEYSPRGHARIATFTGRPTVVGWEGHELFWGHADRLGTRAADVAEIYSTRELHRARVLLARYGVDYVVVGPLERETYPSAGTATLAQLGERVFAASGTEVWRITRRPPG